MQHIDAGTLLDLLRHLEVGDPLDLGNLPIAEEEVRKHVAVMLSEFSEDLSAQGLGASSREALALATAARHVA